MWRFGKTDQLADRERQLDELARHARVQLDARVKQARACIGQKIELRCIAVLPDGRTVFRDTDGAEWMLTPVDYAPTVIYTTVSPAVRSDPTDRESWIRAAVSPAGPPVSQPPPQ